jgi:hypothetical protein
MVPQRVDGLLVSVAASTTHVAFSTIRMEPCWMALGQAAGVAAALAVEGRTRPRDVPVDLLQRTLLQQGQIVTFFYDLHEAGPHAAAIQFLGAHGLFNDYWAWPDKGIDLVTAQSWMQKVFAFAGEFESRELAASPGQLDEIDSNPNDALVSWQLLRDWFGSASARLRLRSDLHTTRLTRLGEVIEALVRDPAMIPVGAAADSVVSRGEFCTLLYRLLERLEAAEPRKMPRQPVRLSGPHRRPVRSPLSAAEGSDIS